MGFSYVVWILMVIDEHKDDSVVQWTQGLHNVTIMDTCWVSLLVVPYSVSIFTFTLEYDTKVITSYRNTDLSALVWRIIFSYKHNSNDTLWWKENVDCCCGTLLTITLSWPVTLSLMQKCYPVIHIDLTDKIKMLFITVGHQWCSPICW